MKRQQNFLWAVSLMLLTQCTESGLTDFRMHQTAKRSDRAGTNLTDNIPTTGSSDEVCFANSKMENGICECEAGYHLEFAKTDCPLDMDCMPAEVCVLGTIDEPGPDVTEPEPLTGNDSPVCLDIIDGECVIDIVYATPDPIPCLDSDDGKCITDDPMPVSPCLDSDDKICTNDDPTTPQCWEGEEFINGDCQCKDGYERPEKVDCPENALCDFFMGCVKK